MDTQLSKLLQDESEDAILARIQEESLRYFNEVELPRRAAERKEKEKKTDFSLNQSDDLQPQPHCSKQVDYGEIVATPSTATEVFYRAPGQGADGFHLAAGETYVYPTNYPVRQYQKTIIHSALFHNTLVSLPTGLGKTFIAAVVMYNFYRWFPQGKIVFMAPTRPLVAQQIRACHEIMAIPINDTIEMTGAMHATDRLLHWKSKRVFFLTPQVMANDLRSKACPPSSGAAFRCVVIDEAHRATKEYSYCHVIKELEAAGAIFRVVALSATPGSNIKAVIEVVQNLRISTLELRGEDSPDVVPYTHAKQVEPISLTLSKDVSDFREQFLLIFERYAKSLRECRLITCNVQNLTKFQLLKASEKMRSRPPNGMSKARVGAMMSDFTVCMTLAHGLELIQTYGLRAFYQYFTGACEDEENRKGTFTRLSSDGDFQVFMNNLHKAVTSPMDQIWSHPKHERLVKILKDHFCLAEQQGSDTKVIIFCQYRVVVSELYELLQKTHPLIKPVMFIGQGVGKDKSGLPQKKQIEVMKGFRQGISNVLIATCVAEEGLDIGSVDLLVMMECQRSPVRLVQRLGRTGRHRQGRCVVLLTCGKEVQKFNEAMATRKSFISMIQNSNVLKSNLIKEEPQMIPPHIMPKLQLVHINVPQRVTPAKKKKQADIRQALMTKINECDDKELEDSPFLDLEQMAEVEKELGGSEIKFESLTCKNTDYLFHRISDAPMQPDELFSDTFTRQSEYNDWNRVLHQTYLVLHSSDTETLCHLLQKSESMLLNTHADLNSQQVNCSTLIPQIKETKKNKTKNDNISKKKKNEKETKYGRDIRECMAQVADKVRLTQDKVVKENELASKNANEEEEIVESFSGPIELEISDSLTGEAIKEMKNTTNEELKDLKCAFCDKAFSFSSKYMTKKSSTDNNLLRLNLKTSESLLKNLSKEAVNSINIADIFNQESNILKTIKNSLFQLKNKLNHSISKKIGSPLISVDDIFDTELNSSPSPILDTNLIHSKISPAEETKNKPGIQDEDFFNLEDLFNEDEDDISFQSLATNTKTSTPIRRNHHAASGLINKSSNSNSVLSKLDKFKKNSVYKDSTKITNNLPTGNSDFFSPNPNFNSNHIKPVFKIPQMTLKSGVLSSPQRINSASYGDNLPTPVSPILSGQTTTNQSVTFSPILCSQIAPIRDSSLSPVLSGQVILNENNLSPILSGQITSTPKVERKVLFKENSSKASEIVTSALCKPLATAGKYSDVDMAEIEALNMFSASQLFDDSSEEEKKVNLDQSSMYTVSQMVEKVSLLAEQIKMSAPADGRSNTSKKHTTPNKCFEDSDEDYIFDQINLDYDISQNESAKDQLNTKNNLGSSFKSTGSSSKYKNELNNSLGIEKNEIEKIKLLKSTNTSTSFDDDSQTLQREFSQRNDESFISSRWLTCMKTPLKTNKAVSFATETKHFSCDSYSDNDVFESPTNKNKAKANNVKPKIKNGKLKKQGVKAQFLELEADVSVTGGVRCSSDEENTSGLDELDASFINDMTELVSTSVDQTTVDIQAKYLQSVKSPMKRPGFKIPAMTDSILERDVFSQAIPEYEDDSYENDSFCCDATQIPVEDELSELEMAERLLKQKRKTKKRKRRPQRSESSSDEVNKSIINVFKKKRLLTSSSSSEDLAENVLRTKKRKYLTSSESSPNKVVHSKKVLKKKKKVQLLTSSDSDSDKTIL